MTKYQPHAPRFRKVFTVFMILVAVPSFGISGFGIMAIVDARDVAEARLKLAQEHKLRGLASDLGLALSRMPEVADEAAAPGIWSQRAITVLPQLTPPHFPGTETVVELVNESAPGPEAWTADRLRSALKDWMEGRAQPAELFKKDYVTELTLPHPLAGYRLQARLAGVELLAAQVRTTAALYAILLVVFYALLILGVVIVSMSMYREIQLGRLKTDFVSHVSHELRTPLTSIRMFLETLLMDRVKNDQERKECLEMCARETERLSGMIERVLDWAKVEAGRRHYDRKATTVHALVDRAVNAFATQALEAPYQLHRDEAAADSMLWVDPDAMTDALLNLLHNAFKYTGAEKRIDVRAVDRGAFVDISVSDNGVGVAGPDQKKIFERFYRAEDLLTQRTHGTGLGLSLAKRIVEAHGGKILLNSRKGMGSTFTLRLPRATHSQQGAALPAAAVHRG